MYRHGELRYITSYFTKNKRDCMATLHKYNLSVECILSLSFTLDENRHMIISQFYRHVLCIVRTVIILLEQSLNFQT